MSLRARLAILASGALAGAVVGFYLGVADVDELVEAERRALLADGAFG